MNSDPVIALDTAFGADRHRHRSSNRFSETSTDWPDPVDFLGESELTGNPSLRPGHIPDALYPFVCDASGRMGVDASTVGLASLACCASVITDDWHLQPKQHDDTWTEQARLWVGIIAGPSFLKTPIIKACSRPIDKLDADARQRHTDDSKRYRCAMKRWKEEGSDPEIEPRAPRLDRYMVEGFTVDALTEVLRDDPEAKQRAPARKVLMRHQEMSEWIASFDRYRPGGSSGASADRGACLRLYDGNRSVIDRVGRGTFAIPNWSACLLGAIQPEPIQRVAQHSSDDGLLQRMAFSVPSMQQPGEDRIPDRKGIARYDALFPALAALQPSRDQYGNPVHVVLHRDAHQHRLKIDQLVRIMSAMPDTSSRMQSALGKWPGLFARLALTFHLIDIADSRARGDIGPPIAVVSEDTARRVACYMEDILLPNLIRANTVMFLTPQTGHSRWIAGYIVAHVAQSTSPRLAKRDVVRAYPALRAPERNRDLIEVMDSLVTIGWLRPENADDAARSPSAWLVNPLVLSRFAEHGRRERERRKAAQEAMGALIRAKSSRSA